MAENVLEDLRFPAIYCPLEPAINPACDRVRERAIDWIDRFGLYSDGRERAWVIASDSADFYARFAPAADEERLLATTLWVYWGFAFDDVRCDAGHYSSRPEEFVPMAARVQRALERPIPAGGDDVYARALQDIAERFRRLGTPVQFQRFAAAHRAWLGGVAWQIANQARGHMPGLDDYLTMRLHSAGGEPTFAMLEIADGAEVPAAEMDSPQVRALTEMAIATAALDNDRHSLCRELSGGQAGQNIYTVLRHRDGGSLAAAVRTASGVRDRILCRFLHVRDRVRPGLSPAGRRYLDGLAYGIRGNAEWGLRVRRYLADDGDPEPDAVTWADAPTADGRQPLSVPTAAWWWDL